MRKSILFIAAAFLLVISGVKAQTGEFLLNKNDVKPGFIAAMRQYNDSSLWGYINGGADIYLEYGFKKLTHQEIVFRGLFFKTDVYEMTDSAAAFGIFSVSVLRCETRNKLTTYDCFNPNQVQFCAGPYYVSITNVRGDTNAIAASTDLASRLLKKGNFQAFEPGAIFQSELLADYQSQIKVIYGPLGLQNGFPDWSGRFEDMQNYYITMLPLSDSTGSVILARISFGKPEDLKKFRETSGLTEKVNKAYWKNRKGDQLKAMISLDDSTCLYLETFKKHKVSEGLIAGFEQVGAKAGKSNNAASPK